MTQNIAIFYFSSFTFEYISPFTNFAVKKMTTCMTVDLRKPKPGLLSVQRAELI